MLYFTNPGLEIFYLVLVGSIQFFIFHQTLPNPYSEPRACFGLLDRGRHKLSMKIAWNKVLRKNYTQTWLLSTNPDQFSETITRMDYKEVGRYIMRTRVTLIKNADRGNRQSKFFWPYVFIFFLDSLLNSKQLCQRNHIFLSYRWFLIKYFSSELSIVKKTQTKLSF